MNTTGTSVWFAEPSHADTTYRREETVVAWLQRSTDTRAQSIRHFLNENLAYLPGETQASYAHALKSRWDTALTELIVARSLQVLGATIDAEPLSGGGTRIDLYARFPDMDIAVEVITPVFHQHVRQLEKRQKRALDYIADHMPPGWSAAVLYLPDFGEQDSLQELRRAMNELQLYLSCLEGDPPHEYERDLPHGPLKLAMYPRVEGGSPIAASSLNWWGNDSKKQIINAVKNDRKRKQARNTGAPALLAIGVPSGTAINHLKDFDRALFGEEVYVGANTPLLFEANGVFALSKNDTPPYIGVLAYVNVGLYAMPDPVVYWHPRYKGVLPEALLDLEQHRFDSVGPTVVVTPARIDRVLAPLHQLQRGQDDRV